MKPADAAGGPFPPQPPAAQRPHKAPGKHAGGAPTKYTPETVATILEALAEGNTKEDAATVAGVTYTTMRTWELADPEFLSAVQKAIASARREMVRIVTKIAKEGNWQAAMTFLERRDPEHWGRKDRVSLSVDLNREARRLAQETGLDEAAILAEAEARLRNG